MGRGGGFKLRRPSELVIFTSLSGRHFLLYCLAFPYARDGTYRREIILDSKSSNISSLLVGDTIIA